MSFNALYQNQRLGLALTSAGGVVIGWSSHCDNNVVAVEWLDHALQQQRHVAHADRGLQ